MGDVKSMVGKWHRSLTKGSETALCRAQPREKKGANNTAVLSGRYRTYEEKEQSVATGEDKAGDMI